MWRIDSVGSYANGGVFHGRLPSQREVSDGIVLIFQHRGRSLGEVSIRGQRPPAQAFADTPHVIIKGNSKCVRTHEARARTQNKYGSPIRQAIKVNE